MRLNQASPWTTDLHPALSMIEWNDLHRSLTTFIILGWEFVLLALPFWTGDRCPCSSAHTEALSVVCSVCSHENACKPVMGLRQPLELRRGKFTELLQRVWTQFCFTWSPHPSPDLQTSSLTRAVVGQDSLGWALQPLQVTSCFLHKCKCLYVWKELDSWDFLGGQIPNREANGILMLPRQYSCQLKLRLAVAFCCSPLQNHTQRAFGGLTGSAQLSVCPYLPLLTPNSCSNGCEGLIEQGKDGMEECRARLKKTQTHPALGTLCLSDFPMKQ